MLTYRITLSLSNGRTEVFTVWAKNPSQAGKFGLSTGKQILKQKCIKAKIVNVDVVEYYDV